MGKFELSLKPSAKKELQQLPTAKLRRAVDGKIAGLADSPKPPGCRKVGGLAGVAKDGVEIYRLRQGDYRVLYAINEEAKSIRILRIAHRKNAYRGL